MIEARLLAYALIAGVGLLVVTTVMHWRSQAQRLPEVEMRLAATLAAQETARRIRTEVTLGKATALNSDL